MASPRRVGVETSKTRAGTPGRHRATDARAGIPSGDLPQCRRNDGVSRPGSWSIFFPTLDELFLALLRRRSERNHELLLEALESRPDEPLRVVWEFNTDETSAVLMMEFLALANHRKSIKSEIAKVTRRARKGASATLSPSDGPSTPRSPTSCRRRSSCFSWRRSRR